MKVSVRASLRILLDVFGSLSARGWASNETFSTFRRAFENVELVNLKKAFF